MFLIPRRQIWTQQPPGFSPLIHPSFQRAGSRIYAPWLDRKVVYNPLGGKKLPTTPRGNVGLNVIAVGRAGKFSASNSDCITDQNISTSAPYTFPQITLFVGTPGAATGAIRSQIGVSNYGGRYTGIRVSAAANTFEYLYYGSNSAALITDTTVYPDDSVCRVVGISRTNSDHELWVNGQLVGVSTGGLGSDPGLDSSILVGAANNSRAWNERANGLIALAAIGRGPIPKSAGRDLSTNPWQIFAPRESHIFVPVSAGGGSTLNAAASGGAVADGSASLAAQVALSGVGVSTADGSATAAVGIPLSAAGLSVTGGAASAQATVTLSAAGLAQAAGQAGLSASVLLAGAGAAQAAGNATLAAQLNALASGAATVQGTAHLTGSAPGELAAHGNDVAGGSAVLQVTVGLQATGAGQVGGTANAQAGAAGAISAAGSAVADGVASTSLLVTLTAAGFVQAMGAGFARFDVAVDDFPNVTSNPKYIVRAAPRHYTVPAARRNYTVGAL